MYIFSSSVWPQRIIYKRIAELPVILYFEKKVESDGARHNIPSSEFDAVDSSLVDTMFLSFLISFAF